jgi:hypothetical protein
MEVDIGDTWRGGGATQLDPFFTYGAVQVKSQLPAPHVAAPCAGGVHTWHDAPQLFGSSTAPQLLPHAGYPESQTMPHASGVPVQFAIPLVGAGHAEHPPPQLRMDASLLHVDPHRWNPAWQPAELEEPAALEDCATEELAVTVPLDDTPAAEEPLTTAALEDASTADELFETAPLEDASTADELFETAALEDVPTADELFETAALEDVPAADDACETPADDACDADDESTMDDACAALEEPTVPEELPPAPLDDDDEVLAGSLHAPSWQVLPASQPLSFSQRGDGLHAHWSNVRGMKPIARNTLLRIMEISVFQPGTRNEPPSSAAATTPMPTLAARPNPTTTTPTNIPTCSC